ncbi:MAG: hypothetical protein IJB78_05275 [Oscillospiraceae bacterium]|nr:hypothetical protein [Oscillospiraceae bacterium]
MDNIKDIAKRLIEIMKDDDEFEAKFERNPAKSIEEVLGIELPDEKVNSIVKIVKTKLDPDNFDLDDLLDKDKIPGLSKLGKLLD